MKSFLICTILIFPTISSYCVTQPKTYDLPIEILTKICRSSTQTGQAFKECSNGIQWYSATITAVGCGATEAEAYERATQMQ